MEEHHETKEIFKAYYAGVIQMPFPAITTYSSKGRYVGYFMNSRAEQLLFIYDPKLGGGILTGGDFGWEIIPLGDRNVPFADVSRCLADDERYWLGACWMASAPLRPNNKDIPDGAMALGAASAEWRVRMSVLMADAEAHRLEVEKMGNVWITTHYAMEVAYGYPQKSTSLTVELGQEIDLFNRGATDEIRKELLEG